MAQGVVGGECIDYCSMLAVLFALQNRTVLVKLFDWCEAELLVRRVARRVIR